MYYEPNTQDQRTIGELFTTLSNQIGVLFRQEMQLAQAEMTRKVTRAGRNAAFIAIGAVLANAALLALVAALILGLAQVMNAWLAALLVGVVLAIVAGLLVKMGIDKLKAIDPAPRRTIETMRENKEWLSQQI
jgi:hypothetical protein